MFGALSFDYLLEVFFRGQTAKNSVCYNERIMRSKISYKKAKQPLSYRKNTIDISDFDFEFFAILDSLSRGMYLILQD